MSALHAHPPQFPALRFVNQLSRNFRMRRETRRIRPPPKIALIVPIGSR